MKKIVAYALAFVLTVASFSTPTLAATSTRTSTGQTFDKAWELTASGTNWIMKYGYNTAWINEDYTHTYHSNNHHVATVSNSRGSFSDEDNGGKWAEIEVRHSGSYITYSISY